jgi:hypothetical protein
LRVVPIRGLTTAQQQIEGTDFADCCGQHS